MYVGIIDQDLIENPKRAIPSLELMKVSSYYKKTGIVELCLDYQNLKKFDKIYIQRTLLKGENTLPRDLLCLNNVEWLGIGFTGTYIPLPPEINACLPDLSLYQNFITCHQDLYSEKRKKTFRAIFNPEFSLHHLVTQGKILEDYHYITSKKILLYDLDLCECDYGKEALNYLLDQDCDIYFLETNFIDDPELFKKAFGKVHRLSGKAALAFNNVNSKKEGYELVPYCNSNQILAIKKFNHTCSIKEFEIRQFKLLMNCIFYGAARDRFVKVTYSNSKEFQLGLFTELNRFAYANTINSSYSLIEYASRGNAKKISELCKKDPELKTLCYTKICAIHQRGVWF